MYLKYVSFILLFYGFKVKILIWENFLLLFLEREKLDKEFFIVLKSNQLLDEPVHQVSLVFNPFSSLMGWFFQFHWDVIYFSLRCANRVVWFHRDLICFSLRCAGTFGSTGIYFSADSLGIHCINYRMNKPSKKGLHIYIN